MRYIAAILSMAIPLIVAPRMVTAATPTPHPWTFVVTVNADVTGVNLRR